jgi:4-hydroxybenzoate polyprenyltransferase
VRQPSRSSRFAHALAAAGRYLAAYQRFVRLPAFGFTALVPLLGAATVRSSLPSWLIGGLLGVALAFHQFGYVLNDVIDLPVDRLHADRAGYPLVRQAITPRHALWFALAQIPLACVLTAWLRGDVWSYTWLAGGFAGGACYDIWGKRMRFPPITDLIQGLAWACMIMYGARIAGMRAVPPTWLLASYIALYITQLNGVHGSLRDLRSDLAAGMRTTAIVLGARPHGPRGYHTSQRLAIYALGLQAALSVLIFWLLSGQLGYARTTAQALAALVVLLQLAGYFLTALTLWPPRRAPLKAIVLAYVLATLLGLIGLFAPALDAGGRTALLLAFAGPLLVSDAAGAVLGRVWRHT